MAPTFMDFFKSFYYSNTYASSVDLSDQGVTEYMFGKEDSEIVAKAQKLISNFEVQAILSEPLTYDPEQIKDKNETLKKHGFKLLSSKPLLTGGRIPFYSVVEHDELQGWIIKSGAKRVLKDQLIVGPVNDRNEMAFFTEEESLLRIEMANRITRVAREAGIEVVVPKKRLVAYENLKGVSEVNKKYCVVCEKINILSVEATVQAIENMDAEHQKELARKITTIVQKVGFVDSSFDNIRLTPDKKIAFIDTEPAGLVVVKKKGLLNRIFGVKGASVEKCARIGLFLLMNQTLLPTLQAFQDQVKIDYEKAVKPKLSTWKIALSVISVGLIPLINVVVVLFEREIVKQVLKKLQSIDFAFGQQVAALAIKPEAEQKRLVKEYQHKRTPIAKRFFSYIENVPFQV